MAWAARRAAAGGLAAALVPVAAVAATGAAPGPPIQFVDAEPLAIDWNSLQQDGVALQVLNNTTAAIPATIRISPFGFSSRDEPLTNDQVLAIETAGNAAAPAGSGTTVMLGAATVTTLSLRLKDAATPDQGLYPEHGSAVLSVASAAPVAVIHRRLRIRVGTDPPPPEPLVASVSCTAYRLVWPLPVHRALSCVVPLDGRGGAPRDGRPLGVLAGKRGGTARVLAGRTASRDGTKAVGLDVQSAGLSAVAGEYSGTIQLGAKDDKKTAVALSVTVKDDVPIPLAMLWIGTMSALSIKRYLGVSRGVWALRAREAAAALAFAEGERSFAESSAGERFAGYSLTGAFRAEQKLVIQELDTLERSSGLALDTNNASYGRVSGGLKRLENAATSWKAFAAGLVAVEAMRVRIQAASTRLPEVSGDEESPNISEALTELLTPRPIRTLADLDALQEEVAAARQFASLWLVVADAVLENWARAGKLLKRWITERDRQDIEDAQGTLGAVAHALRTATTLDDLVERRAKLEVADAERTLARIGTERPGAGEEKTTRVILRKVQDLEAKGIEDVFLARARGPSDIQNPEQRLVHYTTLQRRWDSRVQWVALVVAVLTGLKTYYLDKPFGTLGDYVGLFVVALGTRAAADAISATLDWYGARAAPKPHDRSIAV